MRAAAAALLATLSALVPSVARADDADGAYGRLDGDLLLQAGAGVAVAFGGPHLAIDLHALYLSSAGFYARYTDALGQKAASFERTVATGIDVRPFFLARWAQDLEKGPPRLDLFVDSLSIQFGAAWQQPQGMAFKEQPAFEIGLGLEFPLLKTASGPFIGAEGVFRFDDLQGKDKRDLLAQGSVMLFTVSWHQTVHAGLADIRDRR